jgi:caffeoyl-CoA O-methyltransferase
MSIEIISALADNYASQYSSPECELLKEIADETVKNHAQPHMLSGHVQGRFLSFISKLIQPEFILEIGTFTGYSALCLAEGLQEMGQLHTIELREQDATVAQSYFDKSEKKEKIILHTGNAKEILPTLPHPWDLVFIDADKIGYIDYYELVLTQLSPRGIIIADNVLFHGQVLEKPVTGKNALAMQAFNNHILNDPRVEQVLLTVRDGLLLIKKK